MTGAVLIVVVLAVILVAIAGVTPFILIPVVVIGLGLLVVPLVLGAMRGTAVGEPDGGPSGVPTTSEASYEPVREP
jgi:hypothetical protein